MLECSRQSIRSNDLIFGLTNRLLRHDKAPSQTALSRRAFSQKARASAGTLISFVTLDLVRFYHGPEN
jgi:hypothetical protein